MQVSKPRSVLSIPIDAAKYIGSDEKQTAGLLL